MTKNPALETVVSHLRSLAVETTQIGVDINVRREFIDRYFFAESSIVECSITPEEVDVGSRKGYWFVPEGGDSDRRLLYIHGGSWMSGSVKGYRAFVARLAEATGCALLFVDYSLAPENPFPAGLNDCVSAFRWIQGNGPRGATAAKRTFIAGDSAGGNLTLAALLACKEQNIRLPDAALAISPCTDFTGSGESMVSRSAQDPIILPAAIGLIAGVYLQHGEALTAPLTSPLYGDLTGLPPLMIQTGDAEVLRDDSTRFAEKAQAAGVDVNLEIWPDMPHVFQGFAPFLPQASEAIEKIGAFFKAH